METIYLAKWESRFWAWLIDILLVGALSNLIANSLGFLWDFDFISVASFGKAFLLPLDCLIGWLAMPNSKLRLFNRIANTIVIRTKYEEPAGAIYVKEEE